MHRFIALVWNPAASERSADAKGVLRQLHKALPDWICALEAGGVMVFSSSVPGRASRVYRLAGKRGVIIGTLFRRGCEETTVGDDVFSESEAGQVLETRGRHLVTRYWGRYAAFLRDKAGRKVLVVRDPCGAFPCYRFCYRGIDVFFSRVEDVCSLGCFSFSVNWSYVASHLLYDQLRSPTTGLEGVYEVLPGECIETDGKTSGESFLWHPAPFCRDDPVEDSGEAASALRRTTRTCVSAWASCYDTILHELSGGLDSSIVLACLGAASTRPALSCVNIYSERAEGDERLLARTAASAAGCPLVEAPVRSSAATLRRMLCVPRIARPHISTIGLVIEDAYIDVAREHGADAFFSGQGGDHLFHQRRTPLEAADYVRRHGFGPRLRQIVADTAHGTRRSVWAVWRSVLVEGALRRRSAALVDLDRASSLLAPDILASIEDESFLHPWLTDCRDLPPAKLAHLADMVNLQSYYIPFGRSEIADAVYPLFSQPLVELCLSIPSYVLTEGGRDRALARRAFADMVPEPIIAREAKGAITHFYSALLNREIGFVRELLLDGMLVRARFLDRKRLERQLAEDRIAHGDQTLRILIYIGVEAWARAWSHPSVGAAA